jgi:hypothetical protein
MAVTDATGSPVKIFFKDLDQFVRECGIPRDALARKISYTRSQLYKILDGEVKQPPKWDQFVQPLVTVCSNNDPVVIDGWKQRHTLIVDAHKQARKLHPIRPPVPEDPVHNENQPRPAARIRQSRCDCA